MANNYRNTDREVNEMRKRRYVRDALPAIPWNPAEHVGLGNRDHERCGCTNPNECPHT